MSTTLNLKTGVCKHYLQQAGTDPEIFDGGWLSGWLPVLYYTKQGGVAGKQ